MAKPKSKSKSPAAAKDEKGKKDAGKKPGGKAEPKGKKGKGGGKGGPAKKGGKGGKKGKKKGKRKGKRKKKKPRCPIKRRKKPLKRKCTDMLAPEAVLNTYYTCHGAVEMLKFRKFKWKKKKK